jgi:hypothetical protein
MDPKPQTEEEREDEALEKETLEVEAQRAKERKRIERATKRQKLIDLRAIAQLEDKVGATNVACVEIPLGDDGVPVVAAVRTPSDGEIKKYRHELKPKTERDKPDTAKAAENVGEATLIYPELDLFEKMCAARPGLKVQLGLASLALATGSADAAGKG